MGRFLLANAAWEGTFAGARTFVILYVTVGLGEPLSTSTLVLAAVAGGYVLAALVAGPIGDRFGLARVITWCSLVYGLALLGGGLATQWHAWYLAIIFVVAIFAGLGDDARLGAPLQADAAGRARRDLGARDDDEGDRPHLRDAARGRADRRPPARTCRRPTATRCSGRSWPCRSSSRCRSCSR